MPPFLFSADQIQTSAFLYELKSDGGLKVSIKVPSVIVIQQIMRVTWRIVLPLLTGSSNLIGPPKY